ncbi:hypothetical protein [Pontibacter cellulosilyticus]|uniref:GAF domain-containing protein n=1 Tax=Pontibacter cellulosilyticus TaxID=1720253 RepID=A0A923N5V1_9BACT|nr:hypothetical protein [Pontibacter cellulosilyticus]MBC5992781.1 hypothetical protein [Pontibacter cellulosilyticus]
MSTPQNLKEEIEEFKAVLNSFGVHSALKFLNNRTPHRYTGLYRYDGDTLRNIALYDSYDQELQKGDDAPMNATYCSLLQKEQKLEITDASEDIRVKNKIITPVTSYCGVLIRDSDGEPFGTLCHFDLKRCQERISDFPLLEAAASTFYQHIYPD